MKKHSKRPKKIERHSRSERQRRRQLKRKTGPSAERRRDRRLKLQRIVLASAQPLKGVPE